MKTKHRIKRLKKMELSRGVVLTGAAVVGVASWFFLRRKSESSAVSPSIGPSIGHNSGEVNSEARYGKRRDRDVVDQASWESFPASDPPAY